MLRDLPALLIGLLLAGYWLRVLKMARKARRRTGKAANLVPPEPVGRALRFVWYPAVVVWVVHPFLTAYGARLGPALTPVYANAVVSWAAVAVAALATGATVVCWKRMGKSWRMGIDPAEKTTMIVTGPYAYVRHPIYALSSLLMLATLAAVPTPLMLVVAVVHVGLLQWEARREEAYMERTHGDRYSDYRSHVGRFVPKSTHPYGPAV